MRGIYAVHAAGFLLRALHDLVQEEREPGRGVELDVGRRGERHVVGGDEPRELRADQP